MQIEYKGYKITQSEYNQHTMITKDDKMVFHAETTKPLNEQGLISVFNWYLLLKEDGGLNGSKNQID